MLLYYIILYYMALLTDIWSKDRFKKFSLLSQKQKKTKIIIKAKKIIRIRKLSLSKNSKSLTHTMNNERERERETMYKHVETEFRVQCTLSLPTSIWIPNLRSVHTVLHRLIIVFYTQ